MLCYRSRYAPQTYRVEYEEYQTIKYMNQTKKILTYLGCIAFTVLGLWLLTVEDPTTSYPLWTIRVAGILSIIFFGGGGLFMAYKKVKLLINHKKDIEFTDRGISL